MSKSELPIELDDFHDLELFSISFKEDFVYIEFRDHISTNNIVAIIYLYDVEYIKFSSDHVQNVVNCIYFADSNLMFTKEYITNNFADFLNTSAKTDLKYMYIEPASGIELVASFKEYKIIRKGFGKSVRMPFEKGEL
jgi:hypothetical protein